VRLIALLIIAFSSACQSVPSKPIAEVCILDVSRGTAECVETLTHQANTLLIHNMNNYVSFSPQSWEQIQIYIQKLKTLAGRDHVF
jgi:hypothetical protein